MIDTLKIFEELKELIEPNAAKKIAEILGRIYREIVNTVTKEEFNELRQIVQELAEAQRKTEERMGSLEERMEELAEAQRKTEEEVRKLAISLKETREMVGGLSDTVGYGLEDRAMKYLPEVLKEKYGIIVEGRLVRKYLRYDGKEEEVNIYGKGKRKGKRIDIIGEAKARLSKKDVDRFLKKIKRFEEYKLIGKDSFLLIVVYTAKPEIEEYAKEKGFHVIWSYEVQ